MCGDLVPAFNGTGRTKSWIWQVLSLSRIPSFTDETTGTSRSSLQKGEKYEVWSEPFRFVKVAYSGFGLVCAFGWLCRDPLVDRRLPC